MGNELKNIKLEADGEFVSFAGTDDVICSVASGSYDNDDKLAMLFAAAPWLLEALQGVMKYLTDFYGEDDDFYPEHPLAVAKKAIAKATGTKG